jgi:hypothetical protein
MLRFGCLLIPHFRRARGADSFGFGGSQQEGAGAGLVASKILESPNDLDFPPVRTGPITSYIFRFRAPPVVGVDRTERPLWLGKQRLRGRLRHWCASTVLTSRRPHHYRRNLLADRGAGVTV